jgi:ribosomal protein L24
MQKLLLFLLLSLFAVSITAQTPTPAPALSGIKTNLASGEVSAINQSENKLSLKTTDGLIEVVIGAATSFKRVPPENPAITAAVASSLSEIGEKDNVLVTGAVAADKKSIAAKTIYLMSKSDIGKKLAAEREAWRTRGISGRVVKVDFKTKHVTIATRSMAAETEVVVSPKENAEFMRYAPDSAKFANAVVSNLAEIKVGDQLRALGDRNADGTKFQAEKYLSGSFRTVAGKITAIDAAKNEITIEDTANKKPTVIVLNKDSVLKQFPAETAQMMARAMSGSMMMGGMQPPQGGQGGGMRPPQSGNQPTAGGQTPPNGANAGQPNGGGQRPAGMGGGRGGRGGDLDDMLERMPNITIEQLKVGDIIGVSSSAGTVPNRYTAFKLVSGVEPFLSIPQRGSGGGGNQPTINIPGLDGGFGNP